MTTIANPTTHRKVFFAHLDGLSGTLAQLNDGRVYFFYEASGDLIEVTSYRGLMILGEVGLANSQLILDTMHGSYAKIACQRLQEVA